MYNAKSYLISTGFPCGKCFEGGGGGGVFYFDN